MVLARDPLCRRCAARGLVVASIIADHIVPIETGGSWSLGNGQGLCEHCHNVKRAREDKQAHRLKAQPT